MRKSRYVIKPGRAVENFSHFFVYEYEPFGWFGWRYPNIIYGAKTIEACQKFIEILKGIDE